MSKVFVEEFLYRGRAEGPSAWHVVLGVVVDDGFGETTLNLKGPLTPGQAEAMGYPLSKVVEGINAGVLATLEAERAAHAAKIEEMAAGRAGELEAQASTHAEALEAMVAAHAKQLADQADIHAEELRQATPEPADA